MKGPEPTRTCWGLALHSHRLPTARSHSLREMTQLLSKSKNVNQNWGC